jgi:branched-chain amino acid transport system permease protein
VVALLGAVIEPLLLRPFYRRAEEYQLLVTFGLLLILEDVIRLLWGGLPLSADPLMDALPIVRIAGLIYPAYNLFVIGIGVVAASPRGMNVGWVELRPRATRAYVRSSR